MAIEEGGKNMSVSPILTWYRRIYRFFFFLIEITQPINKCIFFTDQSVRRAYTWQPLVISPLKKARKRRNNHTPNQVKQEITPYIYNAWLWCIAQRALDGAGEKMEAQDHIHKYIRQAQNKLDPRTMWTVKLWRGCNLIIPQNCDSSVIIIIKIQSAVIC